MVGQAALSVSNVRIQAGLGGKGLAAKAAAGEATMETQMIQHGLPVGELLLTEFTVKHVASHVPVTATVSWPRRI